MAGGPIFPHSAIPLTSGSVFEGIHVGATNSRTNQGLGLKASNAASAIWELRFQIPPVVPTGAVKLLIRSLAAATSGEVKVNPAWGVAGDTETPDTVTLVAEGTATIVWAAGESDKYKDTKILLDATAIVAAHANRDIVMSLDFEDGGASRLAVVSVHQVSVIWE